MHVCLFDIDGTLIHSLGAGRAALLAALASEFGVTRSSERLEISGRTDRAITEDLLRMHDLDPTLENRRRLLDAYVHHLPGLLELHTGKVLPGIAELLTALRGRADVVVGLLTGNIREGARVKLGHFGLYDYFAFGGFGDHHLDRGDVAREALAEARQRLNGSLSPDRVWVIGDTPYDVSCARAIGARAVAVATGWHSREELAEHRPDLLLTDLADPTPLLERCFSPTK
jgi:phosphoglycolate phosphatase-like HAD superfamily hydrolase